MWTNDWWQINFHFWMDYAFNKYHKSHICLNVINNHIVCSFCLHAVHRGLGGCSERDIPEFTHKSPLWKHAAHRADIHCHNAPPQEVIIMFMSLFLDASTHSYFFVSTSCIVFADVDLCTTLLNLVKLLICPSPLHGKPSSTAVVLIIFLHGWVFGCHCNLTLIWFLAWFQGSGNAGAN